MTEEERQNYLIASEKLLDRLKDKRLYISLVM
jgi:hypothetical protein